MPKITAVPKSGKREETLPKDTSYESASKLLRLSLLKQLHPMHSKKLPARIALMTPTTCLE